MPQRMDDKEYKLGVSFSPMEAERLLQKLETAEIDFQIEMITAAEEGIFGAIQSVAVYLHRRDWERGLSLLGLPDAVDLEKESPLEELPEADETPVDSGMTLFFSGEEMIVNPTAGDLLRALQEMDAKAKTLMVLSAGARSFLQANGGLDTGFNLAYQDASPDQSYRADQEDLPLKDALSLFVAYLKREPDWELAIDWNETVL